MSAFTKRRSIALAAALGIAPGMSLSSLVFADAAPPATQSRPAASLHNGDLVRVRSGGPLMTVTAVEGDQVNCTWTDWDGRPQSENFPVDVLSVPVTVPPDQISDFVSENCFDHDGSTVTLHVSLDGDEVAAPQHRLDNRGDIFEIAHLQRRSGQFCDPAIGIPCP